MDQKNLSQFNDKIVLVLGGNGFIGSNFIRALFNASPRVKVISFDKGTYSGNPHNLADIRERIDFGDLGRESLVEIKGDIAVMEDVRSAFAWAPDYVINFAAETHVDRSIHTASMEFVETNIIGVYNILECVKDSLELGRPVQKYVQVSTDEVYGQLPNPHDHDRVQPDWNGSLPFSQEDFVKMAKAQKFNRKSPFKPNVPYSATKAAGDCMCNAWNHTWHVPVVTTHCSNNYGPYQYPEKLIPYWVSCIMQGKKIPVYGDGLNIRDWVHVDDHITALAAVLIDGVPGRDYLIGADNERTNLEMVQIIVNAVAQIKGEFAGAVNIEDHFEFVQDRPGHDRRYAIDHSDITRELGWVPQYGPDAFLEKLKETIQWYIDHKDWVEEVIKRTGVANPHIDLWKAHKGLN